MEFGRVRIDPLEILLCPCLENHEDCKYNKRAQIDKDVFIPIGLHYQIILIVRMCTFQSKVLRTVHPLIYIENNQKYELKI